MVHLSMKDMQIRAADPAMGNLNLNLPPPGGHRLTRPDPNPLIPFIEGSFHLNWSVARALAGKVKKF
jgi:hypothetical protein